MNLAIRRTLHRVCSFLEISKSLRNGRGAKVLLSTRPARRSDRGLRSDAAHSGVDSASAEQPVAGCLRLCGVGTECKVVLVCAAGAECSVQRARWAESLNHHGAERDRSVLFEEALSVSVPVDAQGRQLASERMQTKATDGRRSRNLITRSLMRQHATNVA